MGFCYSVGGMIPGTPPSRQLWATKLETNMVCANMLVDDSFMISAFEWRIPSVTLSMYLDDPSHGDYEVSKADVANFVRHAKIGFHCGGDKPFIDLCPMTREVTMWNDIDREYIHNIAKEGGYDVIGSYGQIVEFKNAEGKPIPLPLHRIEKFWSTISWPRETMTFGNEGHGGITVVMALHGSRTRGVN